MVNKKSDVIEVGGVRNCVLINKAVSL